MSNAVAGSLAVVFAVALVFLDFAKTVVWDAASFGVREFSSRLLHVETEQVQCKQSDKSGCHVFDSLEASVSRQHVILERIVNIIEHRVEWFESRTSVHSSLVFILDRPQLSLLVGAFLILLLCLVCYRAGAISRSHGVRARLPNSRPVLCRDGGTFT